MSEVDENKYQLIWKITNFLIYPDRDLVLSSCEFAVPGLDNTEWTFSIRNEGFKLIGRLLRREENKCFLAYNAFLLFAGKDAGPFPRENSQCVDFTDNRQWEMVIHSNWCALLQKRNEVYYCDSLTVCCQLVPGLSALPRSIIHLAQSNNKQIRKRFFWVISNFSTVSDYSWREMELFDTSFCFYLYKSLPIAIHLENSKDKLILENVFLSDVNGMLTSVWNGTQTGTFSNLVHSTAISAKLKDKSRFLPDDKLTFVFEITCLQTVPGTPECEVLGMSIAQNQNFIAEYFDKYEPEIIQSPTTEVAIRKNAPKSLNNDMQNLLSEGILTDFELRLPSHSIQAHKTVLCARSSVFKAMLSTDMKETANNGVDIEDIEVDTIQNLLHFMYSDSIPSLDYDSYVKLYAAADKYDVPALKHGCSKFLSSSLSEKNVHSLLFLAVKHSDKNLKKAAHNFIFKHELVMDSQEWKVLTEQDAKVASETIFSLYQMRSKT